MKKAFFLFCAAFSIFGGFSVYAQNTIIDKVYSIIDTREANGQYDKMDIIVRSLDDILERWLPEYNINNKQILITLRKNITTRYNTQDLTKNTFQDDILGISFDYISLWGPITIMAGDEMRIEKIFRGLYFKNHPGIKYAGDGLSYIHVYPIEEMLEEDYKTIFFEQDAGYIENGRFIPSFCGQKIYHVDTFNDRFNTAIVPKTSTKITILERSYQESTCITYNDLVALWEYNGYLFVYHSYGDASLDNFKVVLASLKFN